MSKSGELPTGGIGSELHEWAVERDRTTSQRLADGLEQAKSNLVETVTTALGVETLPDDIAMQVELNIANICNYAVAQARHQAGPNMSSVFDGEAMNA